MSTYVDLVKQFPLNLIDASQYFFHYQLEINKQPHPQSNFQNIDLAPHDFAGNFYLIWFVNCQTIEINLYNAMSFPWWLIKAINTTWSRFFNTLSQVNLGCLRRSKKGISQTKMQFYLINCMALHSLFPHPSLCLVTKMDLLNRPLSSFNPRKQLFICLQRWFGEKTPPELNQCFRFFLPLSTGDK